METWVHMFLCAILVVLLRGVLLFLHGQRDEDGQKKRTIPPGPPWVPLLGSVVWLTNSAADAEPLLQRLFRRYGPVVSLRVGSRLSIFVADRRLAHAALVEHGASLADRPSVLVAAATLLGENDNTITRASQGPVWRLLRRNLVAQTLHPTRLRLFAPARSWVRWVLADKLRAAGADVDPASGVLVMDAFRHAMFCLLALMCFGERLDEAAVRAIAAAQREQLLYFSRDMSVFAFFPSLTRHLFRGRLHTARALRRRQKELFLPLIDARRRRRNKSAEFEHAYVDTLLDIKLPNGTEHRPLSDQEMINLCSEFLNAGTDTTSTAMLWIMAELVKNPSVQDKLYDEISTSCLQLQDEVSEEDVQNMPYLKAVVLEGLRKHPPGHLVLPHRASDDIQLGSSYLIPKGATVNFMVAEMGRDPEGWDKPMEFVPERFMPGGDAQEVDVTGNREIRMMPFGAGRRICAGLGVAMLHLQYFVANMVKQFEWKEVQGHEVDFAEKREFTSVMEKPLRARLVPRTTSY